MNSTVTLVFDRPPSALRYMLRAARPVTRQRGMMPRIEAVWAGHRVAPQELAAFLRATGLPAGRYLPLLYPQTFGFRLVMAVLTHPSLPFPIWNLLQTRNHLVQRRPIAIGADLDFETRVSAMRHLDKGTEIDLHTTVSVAGALAWESVVTFYARGRFGRPEQPSPRARTPSVTGPLVAAWSMHDGQHWRFGRFTGDYNGIHLWSWYARRFGFPRALYHPSRVLGECLARLPRPGEHEPQRLDAWLRGPVPHGADVRLQASIESDATTFALYAVDERPCLVGRLWRGLSDNNLHI